MHEAIPRNLRRNLILALLAGLATCSISCREEPSRGSSLTPGAQGPTSGVVKPIGSDPVAIAEAASDDLSSPRQPPVQVAEVPAETRAATGQRESDWPEFLGPHQNGISDETGLLEKWPTEGPRVLWKLKIGEGYSAPSIRGNRLVLFHRPLQKTFSGDEEVVECLASDTGKRLWRHGYPTDYVDPYGYNGGPRCTPLLSLDRCYTFGVDGVLTCLNLEN